MATRLSLALRSMTLASMPGGWVIPWAPQEDTLLQWIWMAAYTWSAACSPMCRSWIPWKFTVRALDGQLLVSVHSGRGPLHLPLSCSYTTDQELSVHSIRFNIVLPFPWGLQVVNNNKKSEDGMRGGGPWNWPLNPPWQSHPCIYLTSACGWTWLSVSDSSTQTYGVEYN